MNSEIKRQIDNIVSYGTITETKNDQGLALVRVKLMDRETDFLPVINFSNSYKRKFIPSRIGEQVAVFSPFGEASSGFVISSIFNKKSKEPTGSNDHTEVTEYEDGTVISYDTKAKELKVLASNKITIVCNAATVNANTVDITATTTNTGDVTINGKLTVSEIISGNGGLAIKGGSGAIVTGNISSTGNISDSKGNLTNHTHSCTDGSTAVSR